MNKNKYEDMLYLPHHVSPTHPQMPVSDRAAQFSPFAALTGYDAAIKETARRTDDFVELDEHEKILLDEHLQVLKEHLSHQPKISVTYFSPDEKKSGGVYLHISGNVAKIDEYEKKIVLSDGIKVSLTNIVEMEVEV